MALQKHGKYVRNGSSNTTRHKKCQNKYKVRQAEEEQAAEGNVMSQATMVWQRSSMPRWNMYVIGGVGVGGGGGGRGRGRCGTESSKHETVLMNPYGNTTGKE